MFLATLSLSDDHSNRLGGSLPSSHFIRPPFAEGLLWLLEPLKELLTERESDPQRREMRKRLLDVWGYELETSQFLQDRQKVQELLVLLEERCTNEREYPCQEQLMRN